MKTLFAIFAMLPGVLLAQDTTLSAQEILFQARSKMLTAGYEVSGTLKIQGNQSGEPFLLRASGGLYSLILPELERMVRVDLSTSQMTIQRYPTGVATIVPSERYENLVDGSSVAFADMFCDFFSWQNAELVGEHRNESGVKSWIIRVQSPHASGYGTADLWINQSNHLVTNVTLWNRDGAPAKRIDILSVAQTEHGYLPQKIRIGTFDDSRSSDTSRTYITLDRPRLEVASLRLPIASSVPVAAPQAMLDGNEQDDTASPTQVITKTSPQPAAPVRAEQNEEPQPASPQIIVLPVAAENGTESVNAWDAVLEMLGRHNALLMGMLITLCILLVVAAYRTGWKRGVRERC